MKITDYEYISYIIDLLSDKEIKSLENFEHHRITNRLYHSIDVSYKSYKIGKGFGLDSTSLREISRAGLLHDLFFYDTKSKEDKPKRHLSTHSEIALMNAEKICILSEKEKNIILSHMFGVSFKHLPKYKESILVSMVDKIVSMNEVYNRFKRKTKVISFEYIQQ